MSIDYCLHFMKIVWLKAEEFTSKEYFMTENKISAVNIIKSV